MEPTFVVFVVLGLVVWATLMALLGVFVWKGLTRNTGGGWRRLREQFPAEHEPVGGPTFHRQTVQIGAVRGKNCTTVVLEPQGLYLRAPLLGALLIPWSAIRGAQPTTLFWREAVVLTVGDPPSSVTVFRPVYEAMRPYLRARAEAIVPPELVEVHA